jgi:hypothetical protein
VCKLAKYAPASPDAHPASELDQPQWVHEHTAAPLQAKVDPQHADDDVQQLIAGTFLFCMQLQCTVSGYSKLRTKQVFQAAELRDYSSAFISNL